MEIIDFDALFEKFLRVYMKKNAGKYTEDEWETVIGKKYEKFGKTVVPSLGVSPEAYYAAKSGGELAGILTEHVKKGVSVSDFLCLAIIEKKCEDDIIPLIKSERAELRAYAVNLLNDMGSTKPLYGYLDMLKSADVDDELKELVAEALVDNADLLKEKALEYYEKHPETQKYLIEVLCRCAKDDRIFSILKQAFLNNLDDIPLYVSYLAAYGDERALPLLLAEIEREDIGRYDFTELKYAIERLGGEYEKERIW